MTCPVRVGMQKPIMAKGNRKISHNVSNTWSTAHVLNSDWFLTAERLRQIAILRHTPHIARSRRKAQKKLIAHFTKNMSTCHRNFKSFQVHRAMNLIHAHVFSMIHLIMAPNDRRNAANSLAMLKVERNCLQQKHVTLSKNERDQDDNSK